MTQLTLSALQTFLNPLVTTLKGTTGLSAFVDNVLTLINDDMDSSGNNLLATQIQALMNNWTVGFVASGLVQPGSSLFNIFPSGTTILPEAGYTIVGAGTNGIPTGQGQIQINLSSTDLANLSSLSVAGQFFSTLAYEIGHAEDQKLNTIQYLGNGLSVGAEVSLDLLGEGKSVYNLVITHNTVNNVGAQLPILLSQADVTEQYDIESGRTPQQIIQDGASAVALGSLSVVNSQTSNQAFDYYWSGILNSNAKDVANANPVIASLLKSIVAQATGVTFTQNANGTITMAVTFAANSNASVPITFSDGTTVNESVSGYSVTFDGYGPIAPDGTSGGQAAPASANPSLPVSANPPLALNTTSQTFTFSNNTYLTDTFNPLVTNPQTGTPQTGLLEQITTGAVGSGSPAILAEYLNMNATASIANAGSLYIEGSGGTPVATLSHTENVSYTTEILSATITDQAGGVIGTFTSNVSTDNNFTVNTGSSATAITVMGTGNLDSTSADTDLTTDTLNFDANSIAGNVTSGGQDQYGRTYTLSDDTLTISSGSDTLTINGFQSGDFGLSVDASTRDPDGIGVLDTATGIEWLPLTYTAGHPFDQVISGGVSNIPAGYVIANSNQVFQLLADFGIPASVFALDNTYPFISNAVANNFENLFGLTVNDLPLLPPNYGPFGALVQSSGDAIYVGPESNPDGLLSFFQIYTVYNSPPLSTFSEVHDFGPEPNDGGLTQPSETQVNEGEFMYKASLPILAGISFTVDNSTVTAAIGSGQVVSLDSTVDDFAGSIPSLILQGSGTAKISESVNIPVLKVTSGTILLVQGGTIMTDAVTIDANAGVTGYGTIMGSQTANGTITASGGILDITGSVDGVGTLTFASGGSLQLEGSVSAGEGLIFTSSNETLLLGASNGVRAPVSGFGPGDAIGLESQQVTAAAYNTSTDVLTINGSTGAIFDLTFVGTYQKSDFSVRNGEVDSASACYAEGTRIATSVGDIAIEHIGIGELLICASGVTKSVIWVGHRQIVAAQHPRPQEIWPVRILPHAFGPAMPQRDLLLSPDHAVFVDGVLIPIKYLINGATIMQEPCDKVVYWHAELEHHDIILAEGLPCESYLDTDNRKMFANGGGITQLHPEFAPGEGSEAMWEAAGCAPLRIEGEAVNGIDARLRQRAEMLGYKCAGKTPQRPVVPRAVTADLADLLQPAWYLATNPDVAAAGVDARTHYVKWAGRQEGRRPCPEADLVRALGLIDPGNLAIIMPDVIAAEVDPVEHFCNLGWAERRPPNSYFDTGWYLDTHDVPAGMNPLLHYVLLGEDKGLPPSQHFDPTWYRQHYAIGHTVSPLAHYLMHRRTQRFSPLPNFDVATYVQAHEATLLPDRDPYAHFLAIGRFAGESGHRAAA